MHFSDEKLLSFNKISDELRELIKSHFADPKIKRILKIFEDIYNQLIVGPDTGLAIENYMDIFVQGEIIDICYLYLCINRACTKSYKYGESKS